MTSKREALLLAEMAIRTAEIRVQRRSYSRAAIAEPRRNGGWLAWAMAGATLLALFATL